MDDDGIKSGTEEESNILSFREAKPEGRTYERTMVDNSRRYTQSACPHRGPYVLDRKLAVVECGDCGALLNPVFVLEQFCYRETYWNQRQKELAEHLAKINAEIADRTRTKCTHCGNMTAIKFKAEMPRTWVPRPYD